MSRPKYWAQFISITCATRKELGLIIKNKQFTQHYRHCALSEHYYRSNYHAEVKCCPFTGVELSRDLSV